jgi:hypothetical protein
VPPTQANAATFDMITRPNAKQARAAELLQSITV